MFIDVGVYFAIKSICVYSLYVYIYIYIFTRARGGRGGGARGGSGHAVLRKIKCGLMSSRI